MYSLLVFSYTFHIQDTKNRYTFEELFSSNLEMLYNITQEHYKVFTLR
jgi:hypothetical protein